MEKEPKIEYPRAAGEQVAGETEKPPERSVKETNATTNEIVTLKKSPAPESEKKSKEELKRASAEVAFQMMVETKREFSEKIQRLIEKKQNKKSFSRKEQSLFDVTLSRWWKDRFGVYFEQRFGKLSKRKRVKIIAPSKKEALLKPPPEKEKPRVIRKREALQSQKKELMVKLHTALKNLDAGDPIEQFQEKDRITLFYDEERDQYFVMEREDKRYLGTGDILSDFAWGIKYAPDSGIPRQSFKAIAKRILINETRREIEELYDKELGETRPPYSSIEKQWIATSQVKPEFSAWQRQTWLTLTGWIAEIMCRELLARVSSGKELGFVVMRANSFEDREYKYDFKVRFPVITRGVAIEDENSYPESLKKIKKIGIQFTLRKEPRGKKSDILMVKELYKASLPVDEIVIIKIHAATEFKESFQKWLKIGKPSGGPEQFLPKSLKIRLLKDVTSHAAEIKDEDVGHLFQ